MVSRYGGPPAREAQRTQNSRESPIGADYVGLLRPNVRFTTLSAERHAMSADTGSFTKRTTPFPGVTDPAGRTLGDEEIALLAEVIRSARLNRGAGTRVAELERAFAARYGVAHAV